MGLRQTGEATLRWKVFSDFVYTLVEDLHLFTEASKTDALLEQFVEIEVVAG